VDRGGWRAGGRSAREARRLAAQARAKAAATAPAEAGAAARLDELADRAETVTRQIAQRVAGEKITDRLVSLADRHRAPDRQRKTRQELRVRLRLWSWPRTPAAGRAA